MKPLSPTRQSVQFNIRLAPEELEQLGAFVEQANEQARGMGLPGEITISAVVRLWIRQRLSSEQSNSGRQLRAAPHLAKASALLRGTRKEP